MRFGTTRKAYSQYFWGREKDYRKTNIGRKWKKQTEKGASRKSLKFRGGNDKNIKRRELLATNFKSV